MTILKMTSAPLSFAQTVSPPASPRKIAIKKQADEIAARRDAWIQRNSFFYEEDYRYMRFLVPPGLRVLELGCGTGRLLSELRPSRGVGVDFSARMIEVARQRHPDLEFHEGDVEDADFIAGLRGPFDVIVMYGLLHCLPSIAEITSVVEQALRKTNGGGYHIVATFNDGPHDLTAHPGFVPRADTEAISSYVRYGVVTTEAAALSGVHRVPAASTAVFVDGEIRTERYWRLSYRPTTEISFDDAVAGFRERFEAAVTKRLISDVPVGAFLSGGLDSSSVVAMMASVTRFWRRRATSGRSLSSSCRFQPSRVGPRAKS